jgi:hypothetical protein
LIRLLLDLFGRDPAYGEITDIEKNQRKNSHKGKNQKDVSAKPAARRFCGQPMR